MHQPRHRDRGEEAEHRLAGEAGEQRAEQRGVLERRGGKEMCTSASSMKPSPMKMRATPRALSASVDMNTSTPMATSTLHSHLISSENTCATMAEPTSAPSTTASASGSAIRPRAANEASSMWLRSSFAECR